MISAQEHEQNTLENLINSIQSGGENAKSDVTQLYFLLFNKKEMGQLVKIVKTIPRSVLAKVMLLASQVGDQNFLARLKNAHDGTIIYTDEDLSVEEVEDGDSYTIG